MIRRRAAACAPAQDSAEVLLRLDRELSEPLGAQLRRALRDAIRSGRLSEGERLPSSRVLARSLGISRAGSRHSGVMACL
jgi:GntR family transcriptional regulator/MocR family aminotransferase